MTSAVASRSGMAICGRNGTSACPLESCANPAPTAFMISGIADARRTSSLVRISISRPLPILRLSSDHSLHQRLFVPAMKHSEGGGYAGNEDQRKSKDLQETLVRSIGDRTHQWGAENEDQGGPQRDCARPPQREPKQDVAGKVANHPERAKSENHPVGIEVVLNHHEDRIW